jgi:glycosyltransferase involved in cell wall biosynthesis
MYPEKIPLSAAVITKNEEKNITDCLKSVSFADEIVVVDSGSTDNTVEIARDFGCRVFVEDWKGDGPQKNSAIGKCSHEWVLIVDADERIPEETKAEIRRLIEKDNSADAFSFPRKNYFHGRWIKHCGWWPDRIIRLVKKSRGRYESITHGIWATTGTLEKTHRPIEHYSFSSYSDMLKIMEGRSTDMAKELFDMGNRVNIFTPFFHGLSMFIQIYIFKLGFLDGFDGFIIALTRGGGSFFKYAKLLEIQNKK